MKFAIKTNDHIHSRATHATPRLLYTHSHGYTPLAQAQTFTHFFFASFGGDLDAMRAARSASAGDDATAIFPFALVGLALPLWLFCGTSSPCALSIRAEFRND